MRKVGTAASSPSGPSNAQPTPGRGATPPGSATSRPCSPPTRAATAHATHPRQPHERFQLGCERKASIRQNAPEQRLLAQPVACEHESLARRVPERDREHAGQPLDEVDAVLLVEVRDDRRVSGSTYVVA